MRFVRLFVGIGSKPGGALPPERKLHSGVMPASPRAHGQRRRASGTSGPLNGSWRIFFNDSRWSFAFLTARACILGCRAMYSARSSFSTRSQMSRRRNTAEERSQRLRHREDELPMREIQKNLVGHVLSKQQGSLLAAGRTEVEALAAERTEIVMTTLRVRTSNASHTPPIVATARVTVSTYYN